MAHATHRRVCAVAALVALAASIGCSSNSSTPTTPTPPATVTSVAVTGSAPLVGLTAQLTATATLSNNTTQNVTSQASWQSSNTAVATVSNAGVVTGVAPGDVDITATYQSIAGRERLTVARATFTVSGNVTDATSHGVLPGITMQITSGPSTGVSTKTDAGGAYSLTGVLGGDATVTASATGYETQGKTVNLVANAQVDFVLVRVVDCAYTLSVSAQSAPAEGGSFSVTATSPNSCTWAASTSTPWITLGATAGSSPGTIGYTVAANPAITSRTGTIHVSWNGGSADVTVTEAGAACSFTLNPQSGSFTSAGGTGSFSVTPSDPACGWTASSDSSWLTLTGGQNGTGNGTVSYSVQSYSGGTGPRVGTILVTGTASGLRGFPVQQQP